MNTSPDGFRRTRRNWWISLAVIGVAVVAVLVVLILVDQDRLSKGWAYAVLPVAIIAAASTRVLTAMKVATEDKDSGDR